MGRWTEPLGSSQLHNSKARGLHGSRALDTMNDVPCAATAAETLEYAAALARADEIRARRAPLVVTGCVPDDWAGRRKWTSAAALCEHYGDVEFELASDVTLALREYVARASDATLTIFHKEKTRMASI